MLDCQTNGRPTPKSPKSQLLCSRRGWESEGARQGRRFLPLKVLVRYKAEEFLTTLHATLEHEMGQEGTEWCL